MNLIYLLPFLLGCVGILQGGFVRQMAMQIGVLQATLVTSIITTGICFGFYLLSFKYGESWPVFFRVRAPLTTFQWWYIFPAIFGFIIMNGLPLAIYKLGAIKVTVILIAAQMFISVVWDLKVENLPITPTKAASMVFAMITVILASWRSQA